MIRVSVEVHDLIVDNKIIPQEPHNDCIKRIIKENQQFKKIYFTTQTRDRMEADIKNFVLNTEVPSTPSNSHREIYHNGHPEETLTPEDLIHHVNGNHDDNRIENLQKVSAKEHAAAHAQLTKEFLERSTAMTQQKPAGEH